MSVKPKPLPIKVAEPVKTRKKAERKYQVSWDALQKMNISPSAKDEMIRNGVAQPDPFTRRIADFPPQIQQAVKNLQQAVVTFNAQHGADVVEARLQFVKSKPAESTPVDESNNNQ